MDAPSEISVAGGYSREGGIFRPLLRLEFPPLFLPNDSISRGINTPFFPKLMLLDLFMFITSN
jgi:hypothetical protein